MSSMLKIYHPKTLGEVIIQAANDEEYEMVALASLMLALTPLVYPTALLITGFGVGMAKLVNWLLNHKN